MLHTTGNLQRYNLLGLAVGWVCPKKK